MRIFVLSLFLVANGFFLIGCVQLSQSSDATSLPEASHPEDSLLLPATLHDPLEPVNRLTFAVDKTMFMFALEPASPFALPKDDSILILDGHMGFSG